MGGGQATQLQQQQQAAVKGWLALLLYVIYLTCSQGLGLSAHGTRTRTVCTLYPACTSCACQTHTRHSIAQYSTAQLTCWCAWVSCHHQHPTPSQLLPCTGGGGSIVRDGRGVTRRGVPMGRTWRQTTHSRAGCACVQACTVACCSSTLTNTPHLPHNTLQVQTQPPPTPNSWAAPRSRVQQP